MADRRSSNQSRYSGNRNNQGQRQNNDRGRRNVSGTGYAVESSYQQPRNDNQYSGDRGGSRNYRNNRGRRGDSGNRGNYDQRPPRDTYGTSGKWANKGNILPGTISGL
ncbi:hypothetical protein RF11_08685 [Thelohanellus kitauei]|uniref:Uncharacterized protein n=1 Tax=Thelohanellus kitauei TaxID=669202 RepID=A0A0C2MY61_THEKT|nr:hypothetical protein RF11_08685 [Thelohanellus kitauei]